MKGDEKIDTEKETNPGISVVIDSGFQVTHTVSPELSIIRPSMIPSVMLHLLSIDYRCRDERVASSFKFTEAV